ncbi:glycosyltransferase family 8 protein [Dactylosporangium sp. CA-052675]|uniref:glycosyltransferase family 8 protein n=1 Tax=Dactylosporangium sp. CA-052675 TaxID=3239927 RepID=UPI003D8BEA50
MDIALAFDEGYATYAHVTIESILQSHTHRDDLTLWLLTPAGLQARVADAFRRQIEDRAHARFLTADDGFRSMPIAQQEQYRYISAGMYLRLFLPDLVPPDLTRLLYLDCDTIVGGDLGGLFARPMGGAPLGAVRDGFTLSMGHEGGVPGAGMHVSRRAPYFNSGVLLMNLPVWREAGVTEGCFEYLRAHHDRLRFPDQDALNLVTYGRWHQLESKWNDTILWWMWPGDPRAARYVAITHFLGPRKPWQSDFPYAGYRERYLELAGRVAELTA